MSRSQPPFPRIGQHSSSVVGGKHSPWKACAAGASTPAKSPLFVPYSGSDSVTREKKHIDGEERTRESHPYGINGWGVFSIAIFTRFRCYFYNFRKIQTVFKSEVSARLLKRLLQQHSGTGPHVVICGRNMEKIIL